MKKKDFKNKILLILCLGALLETAGYNKIYAGSKRPNPDDYLIAIDNGQILKGKEELGLEKLEISKGEDKREKAKGIITKDINIKDSENNGIYVGEIGGDKYLDLNYPNSFRDTELDFQGDIFIDIDKNQKGNYALYAKGPFTSGNFSTILIDINKNKERTVQIVGNIATDDYSIINLNLSNKESYLAGDLNISPVGSHYGGVIDFSLENEAIWYAPKDEYEIFNIMEQANENGKYKYEQGIKISSDGGIVDIAHRRPDELREGVGETFREFKLEKINEGAIFTDTTFRIATDVRNESLGDDRADTIYLSGNTKDELSYHIDVAYDPLTETVGKWTADKEDRILVLDATKLKETDKITVDGVKSKEINMEAGLLKGKINAEVEQLDPDEKKWYLTGLEVEETGKGDGHNFADLGAAILAAAWRADSSDLFRRMGDLRDNQSEHGVWARTYGGKNSFNKNVKFDFDYYAAQVGFDKQHFLENGNLFTGVAFTYLEGDTDSNYGTGETDFANIGVYGTWFNDKGYYTDLIIKYGYTDTEIKYRDAESHVYKGDFDNNGFSAELELGRYIKLDDGYYFEPSAQLVYINTESSDYTMKLNGQDGAKVYYDGYESLVGRVGFNIGRQNGKNSIFLKFNGAYEFKGDVNAEASYKETVVKTHISGEDSWIEYGIGFNRTPNESTTIYGVLQRSSGADLETDWHGTIGIRYSF